MSFQIQRVALPPNEAFHVALRRIFGIGKTTGLRVAEACGISQEMKVRDVKEAQLKKAADYIQEHFVTGDQLRRQIRENILRLVNIKARRGIRHELGLPVTSARTHTNANTAKQLKHLVMYDTTRK